MPLTKVIQFLSSFNFVMNELCGSVEFGDPGKKLLMSRISSAHEFKLHDRI